jgi:hypothetical protein
MKIARSVSVGDRVYYCLDPLKRTGVVTKVLYNDYGQYAYVKWDLTGFETYLNYSHYLDVVTENEKPI